MIWHCWNWKVQFNLIHTLVGLFCFIFILTKQSIFWRNLWVFFFFFEKWFNFGLMFSSNLFANRWAKFHWSNRNCNRMGKPVARWRFSNNFAGSSSKSFRCYFDLTEISKVNNKFQVPIIDSKVCQDMIQSCGYTKEIAPSSICAGYANGERDSCIVSYHIIRLIVISIFQSNEIQCHFDVITGWLWWAFSFGAAKWPMGVSWNRFKWYQMRSTKSTGRLYENNTLSAMDKRCGKSF